MDEKKPPSRPQKPSTIAIDRLVETFPNCFSHDDPKPLKIGLGKDLIKIVGVHPALMDLSRKQVRDAVSHYVHSRKYDRAVLAGGPRYDLDGNPIGEVTPENQDHVKIPLKQRYTIDTDAIYKNLNMPALLEEVIAMAIPGKFSVTVKINELPLVKPISSRSVIFAVKSGQRTYLIELKNKQWNTLKEAAQKYPLWMAAITGDLGDALPAGNGFRIVNPAMQVFEKKPREKEDKGNAEAAAATSEPTPPPAPPPPPVPLPPPASGRPRLSLKTKQ